MKVIDNRLLDDVASQAALSNRKRKNYNFHSEYNDPVNRMLNAFEPETYVRPHKHEDPDKIEVFVLLQGKALIVEFDDAGEITSHTVLSKDAGVLGVEIAERVWHTVISLEKGTVLYEVKPGPYVMAADKNFAAWAPEEGTVGCLQYNEIIKQTLGIE